MAKWALTGEGLERHLSTARSRVLQSSWLERLARVGYAAKGLVYLLVGGLAVQAALGARHSTANLRGALFMVVQQPFGELILGVVAVGLATYVFWRLMQALVDPQQRGTDVQAIIKRIANAASAVIFANLTWDAVEIMVGWGRGEVNTAEDWTRLVLAQPWGRWLVAGGGVVVIGAGLYQGYAAWTGRFRQKFELNGMSHMQATCVMLLGRFGLAARGIVFAIIGGFLIVAALQSDAEQARGLGEVLTGLALRPFGSALFMIVALGIVAYGSYTLAEARYRRIITGRTTQ